MKINKTLAVLALAAASSVALAEPTRVGAGQSPSWPERGGKPSVGAEGHPTVTLDQPLDFYQKPRDGAPAVAKVDEKQIAVWAEETEISARGAAARAGGEWRVTAATFRTRDEALALNRALRARGYPSEIGARDGAFTVSVGALAGEAEARTLMENLRAINGVALPVVTHDPATR